MIGVAKYRNHPDSSPTSHIPTGATFDYAVRQGVSLSAVGTAVACREGNPAKTLLGGQYVMNCHVPCASDGVRDPGSNQVSPNSRPIVIGV
jgi:hypothetical protein